MVSTVTQKTADEHETEVRMPAIGSIVTGRDQRWPPAVVSALPLPSTAAQNDAVGHETESSTPLRGSA